MASKDDQDAYLAQNAKVTLVGNQFEPAGADGTVIVQHVLSGDFSATAYANGLSGSAAGELGGAGRAAGGVGVSVSPFHEATHTQGAAT